MTSLNFYKLECVFSIFLVSHKSTDHFPPPVIERKRLPSHIAKSVRISWAILQKPYVFNSRKTKGPKLSPKAMGIFVTIMATVMFTSIAIAAPRVKNPIMMHSPQAISKTPTNVAKKSGEGNPMLSKRPMPRVAGKINF